MEVVKQWQAVEEMTGCELERSSLAEAISSFTQSHLRRGRRHVIAQAAAKQNQDPSRFSARLISVPRS